MEHIIEEKRRKWFENLKLMTENSVARLTYDAKVHGRRCRNTLRSQRCIPEARHRLEKHKSPVGGQVHPA